MLVFKAHFLLRGLKTRGNSMRIFVFGLALALIFSRGAAAQDDGVALVKVLEGSAFAVQSGDRQALTVGQSIFQQDIVETAGGSVGLTFKDGSRISIGPNSRVEFKTFEFSPGDNRLAFLISIIKGTMQYVSGIIAKLSPDAVRIETPVATVVVRGTRLLVKVEGD